MFEELEDAATKSFAMRIWRQPHYNATGNKAFAWAILQLHYNNDMQTINVILLLRYLLPLGEFSLFSGKFTQVFFIDFEEAPSFFCRKVSCSTSLVELYGRLIPFCNQEVHAATTALHRNLTQVLEYLWSHAKTSELIHHKEVFKIKQFSNPRVIGEVVHCKPNNGVSYKQRRDQMSPEIKKKKSCTRRKKNKHKNKSNYNHKSGIFHSCLTRTPRMVRRVRVQLLAVHRLLYLTASHHNLESKLFFHSECC